jgi:eukaryotic-like serine/threonine-protein kinase
MSCLDEDAISALLSGQLDVEALRRAERHMDLCADCRRLVSDLAAELVTVDASSVAEPAVVQDLGSVVDGRFHLEAIAGRGGMGRVYCARDLRTDTRVALKRVDVDCARFAREARVLADLAHPAIVRHVADGKDADGAPYLVMEWLEGEDLAERLERGPLSVEDTVVLARRVAAALGAAHAHGVIHRDIKPSNVFLPDGRVDRAKVVDFGLARAPAASSVRTRAGAMLGTLGYMAPEQAQGDTNVGPAADVFSLGCVLYECLTGERAYDGANVVAILANLLTSKPPRPRARAPHAPRALDSLVARMLARDPAERPASGSEVMAELSSLGTVRALVRSSRLPMVAAVASALAVLAGGAAFALHSSQGSSEAAARAVTDFPAREGTPAEAAVEYQAGLQAIRDAALQRAVTHLKRAVEIDPSLAPAHLRLSIWTDTVIAAADSRAHYQAARVNAHKLAPRDRELLEAVGPAFLVEPPDLEEAERRLEALGRRRPDDAELVLLAIGVSGGRTTPESYERVLQLDPKFAYAWWGRANAQFRVNDTAAARASIQRCLDAAPGSTLCVLLRIRIGAREGRCEEMERDARQVVALENGGDTGYAHLANALTARGADRTAIEETVHARGLQAGDPLSGRKIELYDRAQVAVAFGDFVDAEQKARALEELVKDESFVQSHVRAATLLVDVLEEAGDVDGAAKVADAFLRRRPAWRSVAKRPNDDPVPSMLAAAVRGGLRSPEEAASERVAWAAEWRTKLGNEGEGEIWIQGWARPARSVRDIEEAVAAMPEALKVKAIIPSPPGWILPQGFANAHGGRLQLLAGHPREAAATLDGVTRHCGLLGDAVTHRRALLWLGQAHEATGDAAQACDAYAALLRHWGPARPRSVTAEAGRLRSAALRCDALRSERSER